MAKEIKYGAEQEKRLNAGVNKLANSQSELHLDQKEETSYLTNHSAHR